MHMAIVSIICVALIVFGGMTMARGFLITADTAAVATEEIVVTQGEIMRTDLEMVIAERVSWANMLRIRLENIGQTKLASFSKWDCIVGYYDGDGIYHTKWLPYTDGAPGDNEWQKTGLYLNGKAEAFEPGILNHGEEIVIGISLNPAPDADTAANVVVSSPNGISDSIAFPVGPGYPVLTPHSENRTIAAAGYYQLKEGIRSDGTALTETTDSIAVSETGRWILHHESDGSRLSKHVYSLTGIDTIPASTWTVYYQAQATGEWVGGGSPRLSINIIVRKADGTIRETIAADVAEAALISPYDWQTISGTYDFPGYSVAAYTDYLEIDFYGKSSGSGPSESGNIQLKVDDGTLPAADQTRVEA